MTDPDDLTVADGGVTLDACPRNCGHPWDDHVLTVVGEATVGNVDDLPISGLITCPVDDCDCEGTWSLAITPPEPTDTTSEPEKDPCDDIEGLPPSSSTS